MRSPARPERRRACSRSLRDVYAARRRSRRHPCPAGRSAPAVRSGSDAGWSPPARPGGRARAVRRRPRCSRSWPGPAPRTPRRSPAPRRAAVAAVPLSRSERRRRVQASALLVSRLRDRSAPDERAGSLTAQRARRYRDRGRAGSRSRRRMQTGARTALRMRLRRPGAARLAYRSVGRRP